MSKILSVRTVRCLRKSELKWLASFLHKIHELMHFQQCDIRVEKASQIAENQLHKCGSPGCHFRHRADMGHNTCGRSPFRFVNYNANIANLCCGVLDVRSHGRPVEPSQPAAERWNGN